MCAYGGSSSNLVIKTPWDPEYYFVGTLYYKGSKTIKFKEVGLVTLIFHNECLL